VKGVSFVTACGAARHPALDVASETVDLDRTRIDCIAGDAVRNIDLSHCFDNVSAVRADPQMVISAEPVREPAPSMLTTLLLVCCKCGDAAWIALTYP
jgi:hypothetical protein